MNGLVLEYVDTERRLVREQPTSFAKLLERLEAIRSKYSSLHGMPFGVDLVRDGVGRMVIGLGDGEWILMFHPADDDTKPTVYSLGNANADGTAPFYLGDTSLMSRKYLITRASALRVIQTWFEHGMLCDDVHWTEQIF